MLKVKIGRDELNAETAGEFARRKGISENVARIEFMALHGRGEVKLYWLVWSYLDQPGTPPLAIRPFNGEHKLVLEGFRCELAAVLLPSKPPAGARRQFTSVFVRTSQRCSGEQPGLRTFSPVPTVWPG